MLLAEGVGPWDGGDVATVEHRRPALLVYDAHGVTEDELVAEKSGVRRAKSAEGAGLRDGGDTVDVEDWCPKSLVCGATEDRPAVGSGVGLMNPIEDVASKSETVSKTKISKFGLVGPLKSSRGGSGSS